MVSAAKKDAKDAKQKGDPKKEPEKKEEDKRDPEAITLDDIKDQVHLIEKAVATKEPRYVSRVLRTLVTTRRRLSQTVLRTVIAGYYTAQGNASDKEQLLAYLDEQMDVVGPVGAAPSTAVGAAPSTVVGAAPSTSGAVTAFQPRSAKAMTQPLLPEIDVYLNLLLLIYLVDQKKFSDAVKCSNQLMDKIASQSRRTMDMLAAKCYFYHSRAYELTDQLEKVRSFLHTRLRTSTLHSDYEGQATLLNLLLRNYLFYNLYDQADKLVTKATFPELASNNEWARYLYYLGRIKATQLEYTEAHKNLLQAVRKAPQLSAAGFKQTVQKLAVTVELLLGDIPERSLFRQPVYEKSLAPYFQLTQAVRTGNLAQFNEVLTKFGDKFRAESTYTLIIRLRHNVIKTGVRMINLSYSRISLSDVAQKLQLDSPEDAEYIVAKAIRDGVIEATIDHEKGYVQSSENPDIYHTREPTAAFHHRVSFCLDIHNQSVKAMRFPPKSYNKDLESAEERREREQQELESAKEIAEEDFDGFP